MNLILLQWDQQTVPSDCVDSYLKTHCKVLLSKHQENADTLHVESSMVVLEEEGPLPYTELSFQEVDNCRGSPAWFISLTSILEYHQTAMLFYLCAIATPSSAALTAIAGAASLDLNLVDAKILA